MPDVTKCPVCAEELHNDLVECFLCSTQHHRDCWAYNGGCGTFSCSCKHTTEQRTEVEKIYKKAMGDNPPDDSKVTDKVSDLMQALESSGMVRDGVVDMYRLFDGRIPKMHANMFAIYGKAYSIDDLRQAMNLFEIQHKAQQHAASQITVVKPPAPSYFRAVTMPVMILSGVAMLTPLYPELWMFWAILAGCLGAGAVRLMYRMLFRCIEKVKNDCLSDPWHKMIDELSEDRQSR